MIEIIKNLWNLAPLSAIGLVIYVALISGGTIYQYLRKPREWEADDKAALEGLKFLKEWCSWLATISVAAFSANGFMINQGATCNQGSLKAIVAISVISFVLAICCTSLILLGLPSLSTRLQSGISKGNDVYELQALAMFSDRKIHCIKPLIRVGYLAYAQVCYFFGGIWFFATYIILSKYA